MTSRSSSALRKSNASRKPGIKKSAAKSKPGKLPEWNLADLYSGIDAPEVTRDLASMDAECVAFETDYKGKLAEKTAGEGGGQWLAEAVRRYEAIDDLAGRLGSYAGLVHAGDSVDPAISKFYGDVSERLTQCVGASVVLRARTQPRRRRRDRTRDADARARALSPVDRGSAQGQAVSARGSRRAIVSREIRRAVTPPGTGCSIRPSPACASRSGPRNSRSSRR